MWTACVSLGPFQHFKGEFDMWMHKKEYQWRIQGGVKFDSGGGGGEKA